MKNDPWSSPLIQRGKAKSAKRAAGGVYNTMRNSTSGKGHDESRKRRAGKWPDSPEIDKWCNNTNENLTKMKKILSQFSRKSID